MKCDFWFLAFLGLSQIKEKLTILPPILELSINEGLKGGVADTQNNNVTRAKKQSRGLTLEGKQYSELIVQC